MLTFSGFITNAVKGLGERLRESNGERYARND